jgi:hypothetical protein
MAMKRPVWQVVKGNEVRGRHTFLAGFLTPLGESRRKWLPLTLTLFP